MMLFYHGGMRAVGEERLREFKRNPYADDQWKALAEIWEEAVCRLGSWMVSIGRRLECYRLRSTARSA